MSLQRVVTKADEQGRFRTAVNWSVHDGDEVVASGVAYGWGEERAYVRAEKIADAVKAEYARRIIQSERLEERKRQGKRYQVHPGKPFFVDRDGRWMSEIIVYRPNNALVSVYSIQEEDEVLPIAGYGDSPEEAKEQAARRGRMWVERDLDLWMRRVEAHRKAGIPL